MWESHLDLQNYSLVIFHFLFKRVSISYFYSEGVCIKRKEKKITEIHCSYYCWALKNTNTRSPKVLGCGSKSDCSSWPSSHYTIKKSLYTPSSHLFSCSLDLMLHQGWLFYEINTSCISHNNFSFFHDSSMSFVLWLSLFIKSLFLPSPNPL